MGAGDVKLLAGIGAWLGATATFYSFCVSTVAGPYCRRDGALKADVSKHYPQLLMILSEWIDDLRSKQLRGLRRNGNPRCCYFLRNSDLYPVDCVLLLCGNDLRSILEDSALRRTARGPALLGPSKEQDFTWEPWSGTFVWNVSTPKGLEARSETSPYSPAGPVAVK